MKKKKDEGPYTKQAMVKLLMTNNTAVMKGVLVIYQYQTNHEKAIKHTVTDNGVGFNAADSKILSELALKIKRDGGLSKNDLFKARLKMVKYAGQLAKVANINTIAKNLGEAM